MLGSSLSIRETISMMAERLEKLIPSDCLAVFLRSGPSLQCGYVDGRYSAAFSSRPIALGEGLSGWVALSQRSILNGNPTVESNYLSASGAFSAESSALSVPLFDLAGAVLGVLTIYSQKPAAFSKDHLRILQAIQTKFSLSLQNALGFRIDETDEKIDHLTKLLKIPPFIEQVDAEVERSQGTDQQFAVVVCDLNSFKTINSCYGRLRGNDALRLIAEEFRACCGPHDAGARMGGDEFAFLFDSVDEITADRRLAMLDEALERACVRFQVGVEISCSSGIAFYPEDGSSAEELLGRADRRMYLHKRSLLDMESAPELAEPSHEASVASHR